MRLDDFNVSSIKTAILSVEPILKLWSFSFISALFDSRQISVFELHRYVPGNQMELFQGLILMKNKYQ